VTRNGVRINYSRIALATLGATFAYFVFGGLAFGLLPELREEFRKYPAVYRTQEDIKAVMPIGMAAMLVSILVLTVLYAKAYQGGSGVAEGVRFGALIGLFAVGAFVMHNYVNLNIGVNISLQQAVAYFVEWTIVGLVIGLIYKPVGIR
jgi:hypothetical protein